MTATAQTETRRPAVHYSNLVRSSDGSVNLSVLMRIASQRAAQELANIKRLFPGEKPFRSYRSWLAQELRFVWHSASLACARWKREHPATLKQAA